MDSPYFWIFISLLISYYIYQFTHSPKKKQNNKSADLFIPLMREWNKCIVENIHYQGLIYEKYEILKYDPINNLFKHLNVWEDQKNNIYASHIKMASTSEGCEELMKRIKLHLKSSTFEFDTDIEQIEQKMLPLEKLHIKNIKESFDVTKKLLGTTVEVHKKTLLRKRKQLIHFDDYGNELTDNWDKEKAYFLENVTVMSEDDEYYKYCFQNIDTLLNNDDHDVVDQLVFNETMNGLEYEQFVTELLIQEGWDAFTTKASGDQGADIIAKKDNNLLIVQCKLYSNPVGNKAVQEVFAAKQHNNANIAAVVTNNTFTRSAQELSNSTGVLLLHHTQIDEII